MARADASYKGTVGFEGRMRVAGALMTVLVCD